jgi:hypothetical protein
MAILTSRIQASGVTLDDLIHIVITSDQSQNPAGSSYKATIGQVFDSLSSYTFTNLSVSGNLNVSGNTILNNVITNTLSATTYLGLPGDIFITGGTFDKNTETLTLDSSSGTPITITGFTDYFTTGTTLIGDTLYFDRNDMLSAYSVSLSSFTPSIDTYVTGFTYDDANTITLSQSNGQSSGVTLNTFTGLTINGGLSATSISADTYYNLPTFTGNTSGDCITDLFVSNVNSCSPLHIQPTNTGDVYIGENGGVNVGIGTSSPTRVLDSRGTFNLQPSTNTFLRFDGTLMEAQVGSSNNQLTLNRDNQGITDLKGSGSVSILNTTYSNSLSIGANTILRENDKIVFSRSDNFVFGWWDTSNYRFRIGGGGFAPIYSSTTETFEVVGTSKVTGNVGIGITGSTDSTSRLQIKGSDSSSSNYGLKVQNSGGTDNLVVRNDGNVGIGTSSPDKTFHINDGANKNLLIYNSTFQDPSGRMVIQTADDSISNLTPIEFVSSVYYFNGFQSKVWIGDGYLANPTARLHIKGDDSSSSNYGLKVQDSGGTDNFVVRNDGYVNIGYNNGYPLYSFSDYGLMTLRATTPGFGGQIQLKSNDLTTTTNIQSFGTSTLFDANNLYFRSIDGVSTHIFKEGSTGNVGINTSSPSSKLEVKSDSSTGNTIYPFSVTNNSTSKVFYLSNQNYYGNPTNLGVYSEIYDNKFQIDLTGSAGQFKMNFNNNKFWMNPYTTSLGINLLVESVIGGGGGAEAGIRHMFSGTNTFGTTYGESLYVGTDSSTGTTTIVGKYIGKNNFTNPNATFYPLVVLDGNSGFGTSTPTERLEVNGKTKTTTLQVTSGATTGYILTSDSSGNGTWQAPVRAMTYLLGHDSVSPTDSNTYYIGNLFVLGPLVSSQDSRRVTVQRSGTITDVGIMTAIAGTPGSGELSTFTINNVTSGTSSTITTGATHSGDSNINYTLSSPLTVTKNDKIEVRWVTPVWATNPTTVRQMINVVLSH